METSAENTEKFADKAKRKVRNFFRWAGAILLLLVIGIGLFVIYVPYSEGVRAGTVLKVSKRGVIFRPMRGSWTWRPSGLRRTRTTCSVRHSSSL